jgi:hypothetical protein
MIPKRVFWFSAGAATGFTGAVYAYARVREVKGRFAADRVADTVADSIVGTARTVRSTVRDAVAEGRDAMAEAERRITSDLDRTA